MQSHAAVRVHVARGIEGDRYALGLGHWSYEPRFASDVTFIEDETVERVAALGGAAFGGADSRRNVVTRGVRLAELIGRRFAIDDVHFEGERACEPCGYLDRLLGKPARAWLAGEAGGLRARVLSAGELRVGAALDPWPAARL